MKNKIKFYSKINFLLGLILIVTLSCEREISEDAELATFSKNGDVFADSFSAGLDYFPFGDSYQEAFSVDTDVKYLGTSSMRFDIPTFGAGYGGANFPVSSPRDLSGYDALTFWAKASQGATINEIGFGINESTNNRYRVTKPQLAITTQWRKYTIPIPDPSKLAETMGLFWYAEGAQNESDEGGYTFWIDEMKYEKLGTIAQPKPSILNGEVLNKQTFIGATETIGNLTQTFNIANGSNETLSIAPAYFEFTSSNTKVATVNEFGLVSIVGAGEIDAATGNRINNTTKITATLNGVEATGSLTLESLGTFTNAPVPTQSPNNVISIFSDAYTNAPVNFYNGYYAPFQTTLGQDDIEINGDNIIKYTKLNFVGIEFNKPTINGSNMAFLHIDIQVENPIVNGDFISVELVDFGANGSFGGGDDSSGRIKFNGSKFTTGSWVSLDIPIADFGLSSTTNLGQMLFITDGTNPAIPGNITDILVDNMYFYRTVTPTIPFNFDDDQIDYNFATFNGASFSVVNNPQLSGINAIASKVGALTNSGANWEGGAINLESPVNFGNGNKIKMKIYSTSAVPVLLKFEEGLNGASDTEIAVNHSGSGWEELEFVFSSTNQYGKLVLFVDGPGNTSGTFYIDDVSQSN